MSIQAYIDWNNDADFADANEDVSARTLALSVSRGRASVNDDFAAGQLTILLMNDSGDYSPFNSGSPLYGNMLPGRAIKVEAVEGVTTYPLFYGYITSYHEARTPDGAPAININALDGFDLLRLGHIRIALQESKRADQLVTTILDTAGWSATLRDLDIGESTIGQFWVHRASPLDACKRAAKNNLGGYLFMAKDGKVTWRNRFARSSVALFATLTGPQALGFDIRREDLVDEVQFARAGLDVDTAVTALFTLAPTGRQLQPGTSHPLNTIHGDLEVGGKALVTPVATTDYTANSAADGTGTDKTAQVTVSSFTSYGGGFSITFNNADSSPVYLTLFQVRGQAVRRSNEERTIEIAATSPIVTDQVLRDSFDYYDDAYEIEQWARLHAAIFSVIQPRPTLGLTASDSAERVQLFDAELGDRVRVQNTTGLYPTKINDFFYVEHIGLRITPGLLVEAEWGLFHEDQAIGNFFRISSDDASAEYSTIVTDVATSGERIAV